VRDVAALHVAAFRAPKTGGRRLIASSSAMSMLDMAKVLAVAAPQHAAKIPKFELPAVLLPILAAFDRRLASILPDIGTVPEPETAYVTELTGLRFRTPKEATIAGAQSLMALGVV
jgi:dihydroflavonol-4-reductase